MASKPAEPTTVSMKFNGGHYVGQVNAAKKCHGYGTATYDTGDRYEGHYFDDNFHGQGKYTWAEGDTYTGEYEFNAQHGLGKLEDANGVYVGYWQRDERHGHGKQDYSNGNVYDGEWMHDKRHGIGKFRQSDGMSFEGMFFDDVQEGRGWFRKQGGETYDGELAEGKPHGRGKFTWHGGRVYVGSFVEGKRDGEGREKLQDNQWVSGLWRDGTFDRSSAPQKVDAAEAAEFEKALFAQIGPVPTLKQNQQQQQQQQQRQQPASGVAAAPVVAAQAPAQPTPASPSGAALARVVLTDEDMQHWQPMKPLGKGSFGAVYEAGLPSGKIICVKIIELGSIENDAELRALQNEINLMKRLNHNNIVQYYGCHEDKSKNTLNIFMEYVTGGSLNSFIKRFRTLPHNTVRQWTVQVVRGVKYLHDEGIVHRDIKGDNILVTMDGIVKLADFGCSKAIDEVCSKANGTQAGCKTMVGTPYWMAPEVIKCENDGYGFKSDVWSVGCTVVEMVTGRPPWPESDSMWAAVLKIANSTGLPPGIPKDLSPAMMNFLERCFERDPAKRASAAELLDHQWLRE